VGVVSYKSACLARADCVGFWGLDDAGGATSAADSVATTVALPKIGSPTFGSTGFVDGLATSMRAVGAQAVGVGALTAAKFKQHTALTICGWVKVTTMPTEGGHKFLWGRDVLWMNTLANSKQVFCYQDTTGMTGNFFAGVHTAAGFQNTFEQGDTMFIACTWSLETGIIACVVNGALHARAIRDIQFDSGDVISDTFKIGTNDAASTLDALYSGIALFNRQLGPAELHDLMIENASFPAPSNPGNLESPSASAITGGGLLGTKLTTNGATIVSGDGRVYRPEEYAAQGLAQGKQTIPVTGGWDAKLPFRAAETGWEWLVSQIRRGSLRGPEGGTFFFGSQPNPWRIAVLPPATDPNGVNSTLFFMTSGVSMLNHWIHRGVGGTDSVLTRIVTSLLDTINQNTDANGRAFPLQDGVQLQLYSDTILAVLCAKPYVPAAKFTEWVNMLIKFGEWSADINRGGVFNYYVNGNQNIGACALFYGLFLLTGQQIWLDRYNLAWNVVLYPTDWNPVSSTGVNSAQGPARTAGFGLYTYTGSGAYTWVAGATPPAGCVRVADDAALLALNATTQRAFITESNNIGGGASMGMDHDYLQLILNQAWKLVWLTNKGARELRLFNIMFNQHVTRITPGNGTNSWTADFTGGTRRNAISDPYFEAIPEYVRASGLRPDYTQDLFTHWESSVMPNWAANWHGAGLMHRYLGTSLGNLLMGSSQWTGLPT
jgi:hypothetical protein